MDISARILTPQRLGYFEDQYTPIIQVRTHPFIGWSSMILRVELKNPSFFPNDFLGWFQRYFSILAVISLIWIGWFMPFFCWRKSVFVTTTWLLSSNPLSPCPMVILVEYLESSVGKCLHPKILWWMCFFDGKSRLQNELGHDPDAQCIVYLPTITRWWFEIFFMFTPTWGNDPISPIFFKWVETTN